MSGGRSVIKEALEAYKRLQGVFCIYKPARKSMYAVHNSIQLKLINGVNKMRRTRPSYRIEIEGSVGGELQIKKYEDFSTHPLVIGPLLETEDISLSHVGKIASFASGLCVMGVNERGMSAIESIDEAQLLSTFTVEGKLGIATSDLLYTGRPVEKSTYTHVSRGRVESVLHRIQSIDHRKMIDQLGLPPNSQAAYEVMAADGLVRPNEKQDPIIFGIKLIEISKPHFIIEVTGSNLEGEYLMSLINDIGLQLKTNAHTLQIRCIRHGPFTLDLALLKKHWTPEYVIQSIEACQGYALNSNQHRHASPVSLEIYQEQQMKLLEEQQQQRLLEQTNRHEIPLKLLEDFKAREQYEKFLYFEEDQENNLYSEEDYEKNLYSEEDY